MIINLLLETLITIATGKEVKVNITLILDSLLYITSNKHRHLRIE